MLSTKKITSAEQFNDEVTLSESNQIRMFVNTAAIHIVNSEENSLLELNQTIVKDVFGVIGQRGFHLVAKFSKSEIKVHKDDLGVDIEIGVNENDPFSLYGSLNEMKLEMNIKTINKRKYALQ